MRKGAKKEATIKDLPVLAKELSKPLVKAVPKTRQELLNERTKQLENGEITSWDFAQELRLTEEQFRYAEAFASLDNLGNSEQAAMIAYDINPIEKKALQRARALANRLDKHQGVITLVNALLSVQGWNEENIRKQHLFLIAQNADFKIKAIAIKMWYEVNGKLKKEQEISIKHSFDYSALTTEELMNLKQSMAKAAGKQFTDYTDIDPIQ